MKELIYRVAALTAAAITVIACAKDDASEPVTPVQEAVSKEESPIVEGLLEVRFSDDMVELIEDGSNPGSVLTKSSAVNEVFASLGVTSYERVFPDAGEWEARHRKAGLHKWYRVKYDPALATGTKATTDLSSLDGVETVNPVRRIKQNQSYFFNDPYFPQMWNLYNDGTLGSKYTAGADVNVLPVWQNYTAGTPNVIVSVVDGGVDLEHPDLADICVPAGVNGSKSFVDGMSGYYIEPDEHGTHVAGTIAAINDNGIGVSGIAGGYDGRGGVRIMSCAIFADDPEDSSKSIGGDSANAMVWGADHGAVISQNSWGYVFDTADEAKEFERTFMNSSQRAAIDYFVDYAGCDENGNQLPSSPMKGGVVCFSAGNESWDCGWPSKYERVVAVGAISSMLTKAYYSNYGDWVDICAPGGDYKVGPMILSSVAGGSYATMQGTSMACPHVSGVAALIASYFGGPGFTNEMLLDRLLKGASDKISRFYDIGPLVDALGSFSYGGTIAPDKVEDFSVSSVSNGLNFEWEVTADEDDVTAYGYLIMASRNASDFDGLDPKSLPSAMKTVSVTVGEKSLGDKISGTIKDLEFETPYHTAIIAYDYSNNFSELSPLKTISTQKNNPPVVTTDYTGSYAVKSFQTLSVAFTISDPDGHSFKLELDPGSDAATLVEAEKSKVNMTIVGKNAPAGKYSAHIKATDTYGLATDHVVEYEILENHPPQVIKTIDNLMFSEIGKSMELDANDYFYDEDGEPLKYSVEASSLTVVHVNPVSNKLMLTTLDYGLADITVSAEDALGKSCSISFKVLVRSNKEPVDLYPNPVSTVLNVRPGVEEDLEITVNNKAGATVYSGKARISPFEPLKIDMSEQPAGVYYVSLKGGNTDVKYSIVKL